MKLETLKPAIAINVGVLVVTFGTLALLDRRSVRKLQEFKKTLQYDRTRADAQMLEILDKAKGNTPL